MGFDLLSSQERFSDLDIFVESKFSISDEELQTQYGFIPKRAAFFNIPWAENMIYIMRSEEFSQAPSLIGKFPGLFILSLEEVPETLQPFIFQVSNESVEFNRTLEFIRGVIAEKEKAELLKEAQSLSGKLFREAGQFISEVEKQSPKEMSEVIKSFLRLDDDLLLEKNLNTFIKKSSDTFSELGLWSQLELAEISDVEEKRKEDPSWEFFPLDWLGLKNFLLYKPIEANSKKVSFGMALFLEWLERYTTINTLNTDENHTLWEETVSQIPLPLALINVEGDLLIYNQRFTRLNFPPRDCLNLENDEAVEIQREYFKVKKIEIDKEEGTSYLFLFVNSDQLKQEKSGGKNLKSISSQELGIISSSIAHELNNPLAGILAAIALLELEDWDAEELDALNDMKTSAKRCKTLVEIFLGFSRTRDREQKQGTMREALGQSLDLLRFRMIESDVRIEVDVESSSEPFKRYVNLSLCSMILYLVLGEVLTLFNHHRLVLGLRDLKTLKTNYKEENEKVSLSIMSDIDIGSKIRDSKLIKYLIDVQGLEMEVEKNKIIFYDWKLL